MKWGNIQLLYWLWLLIPLAWLLFRLLRRRERRLAALVDLQVWPVLSPGHLRGRIRSRLWLWLAGLTLVALALARPQWGFRWEEIKRRGLDILVVLDTSNSMLATDIKPNRLQQAKWGIRDLLAQLKGDRIGLLPFAGSSFLECPLTIDYAAFRMTLDDVYAGLIPRGGTAIEQALREALKEGFKHETDADRAIILITDGEDHEGDPLRVLPDLKKKNVRIYAIGIGTLEGELVPQAEGPGYLKDRAGQVIKSALQEDVLQKLALETGGAYVRSVPGDTGLERVFRECLVDLKRDEQESRMAKIYEERFIWPLAAALLLLVIEALLGEVRPKNEEAPA